MAELRLDASSESPPKVLGLGGGSGCMASSEIDETTSVCEGDDGGSGAAVRSSGSSAAAASGLREALRLGMASLTLATLCSAEGEAEEASMPPMAGRVRAQRRCAAERLRQRKRRVVQGRNEDFWLASSRGVAGSRSKVRVGASVDAWFLRTRLLPRSLARC